MKFCQNFGETFGKFWESFVALFFVVSCKTNLQRIVEKNTLQKYDLQESYNNYKIKLKI